MNRNIMAEIISGRIVVGGTSTESNPYTLTEGGTYTCPAYSGNGGAVEVQTGGTVTGSNVTFTGNTAYKYGGAIYNEGTINFTDTVVFEQNVSGSGGAINNDVGSTINFTGSTVAFIGNTAYGDLGYAGAVFNAGTINFGTANVSFSGNVADDGVSGAIDNYDGTINFAGTIDLATESDLWLNESYEGTSTVNWILTGGLDQYATIKNFERYSNADGADVKQTITVTADQAVGDYVIATGSFTIDTLNTNNSTAFTIKTADDAGTAITVGGESVDYNGQTYSLTVQDNSALVLNVTAGAPDMFFACDDWSYGDAVTVKYGGFTYSGTVGDGTFSDYEDEEAPEGKTKAIAGARGFDANGVTLTDNYVNQISGGYRVESEDDKPSSLFGEIELTIESGFFNKSVNGGDTLAYNGAELTREGEIEFTINGGEFRQRVAGGMFYNPASGAGQDGDHVTVVESITLTINGGTFHDRVYGGNNATTDALGIYTTVEDGISLTVNPGSEIVFEDCLVAGSRGKGEVLGNTSITFTGNGGNLTFADDSIVWGGCSGDFVAIDGGTRTIHSSVEGSRTLSFGDSDSSAAFQGDFDAEVLLFTDLVIQNGSEVNFTDEDLDLQDISFWSIEIGSAADLNGANNDFTGDEFEIVGDAGSDPLTLLTADSKCDLSFDSVTWYYAGAPGGADFTKSGDAWVYGGKQLAWTENDGRWSMTLSNVA